MDNTNNAPTLKLWKRLYDAALAIKAEAPWEELWDNDLTVLKLPGYDEPIYISVMGHNDECFGIGVYPGYYSIAGFYRLLNSGETSVLNTLGYQNCLMCYFGSREEIAPEDRAVMNGLGLKFRGANNWVFFRAIKEGHMPWFLNASQAEILADALENFAMAYDVYAEGETPVDFENDQVLLWDRCSNNKKKRLSAAPAPKVPIIKRNLVFDDELRLRRLRDKPVIPAELEIDLFYMPMPVQDDPDQTPYFPRLIFLASHTEMEMIDQHLLDDTPLAEDALVSMLMDYVEHRGKPAKLYVRDEYFYAYIESFCSQVGISVVCDQQMPSADAIIQGFIEFMKEEND